jgi:hypothetical protein
MLAFTLSACESEEKKQTGTNSVSVEQAKTPEEVAKLYLNAATKMDIDMMKKLTTRSQLEKTLALESILKITANENGQSYEEYIKELKIETEKKVEASGAAITTATKVSDNGNFAKVIVNMRVQGMEIPKPIELAKHDGVWKVSDASQN